MSKKRERDTTKRLEAEVTRLQSELARVEKVTRKRINRLEKDAAELRALMRSMTEPVTPPATSAPVTASPKPPSPKRTMPEPAGESPARKAIANWPTVTKAYLTTH
ncbi:hypothetical protein V1Y59_18510 [Gordonia sp. PKS22-38]|uniref:Uncharacterized protein n=1 Tax=Gordonia prachuapensis TaxID=3115651 RepID=A0ABU7MZ81_9ACTN|nr:hypothetical protein [Gordonia sp. PKS22-38]